MPGQHDATVFNAGTSHIELDQLQLRCKVADMAQATDEMVVTEIENW